MPLVHRRLRLSKAYAKLNSKTGLTCLITVLLILATWQASKIFQYVSHASGGSLEDVTDDGKVRVAVWWHAPFYSGGGYSSEAIAFMLALWSAPQMARQRLSIAQHGDSFEDDAYDGLVPEVRKALQAMERNSLLGLKGAKVVVVCHSDSVAWSIPQPEWASPNACPPPGLGKGRAYIVGRTMFETDRLSAERQRRCNAMDEVWVPTEFHREIFVKSGVEASKLHVVPQPVDVDLFNPEGVKPLTLPQGQLVFGQPRTASRHVAFLSVFKWERRKGWDILLQAFLSEFTSKANVALYLKTSPFHSSSDFAEQMQQWVGEHIPGSTSGMDKLPAVYVIDEHMTQESLRSLYAAVDCFVLPSRGEGWGRPHVEAMSMALPVIATDWSGPTAFLDQAVGYPLSIDGLEQVEEKGAFEGHFWAKPSVQHLRQHMRRVVQDRKEAQAKGRAARARMVKTYAPEVVAQVVVEQLRRIEALLASR